MSESLIFYTNPFSRGRTVRWMLEELGVQYETKILQFGTDFKTPEFLSINPMGKVPTIYHNGAVVTESAAICTYLADAFPEANLAPPLSERSSYYRWLYFCAGPLEAALHDKMIGHEPTDDEQRSSGYGSLERVFNTLEIGVSKTTYIAGDQFTAADVFCGAVLSWLMIVLPDCRNRTAIRQYAYRATNRAAWKRAQALDGTWPSVNDSDTTSSS